jgi:hypothetical protein
MSDGTEDLAQTGAETPADEGGIEQELIADTEQLEDGAEVEEELEDLEHGGKQYRIPKALKGGFMMQADYTRKTQELARQREGFDDERDSFSRDMEARRASEKEIGRLAVMDELLDQYQKVDWQALRGTNPEQAQSAFQDYQLLRDQREKLAIKVDSDVRQRAQTAQQDFAKRYEATNATLAKDIKGWNQDTATKLREFALANGATQQDILTLAVNASLVKLLHKAWLGDQLVTKQAAAAQKARAAATQTEEAKPLTTVTRRPSGNAKAGLHDGLSADEWLRRRNAQVKRKA